MPEGFLSDNVDEFVAVLNSTDKEVTGKCTIFYEDGNTLEFDVSFPPKQRSGITLKDKEILWNTGFSTVLETDGELKNESM